MTWQRQETLPPSQLGNSLSKMIQTPVFLGILEQLTTASMSIDKTITRLREKVETLIESSGEQVDDKLHSDLSTIMNENDANVSRDFPEGSLLWDEQEN